jgi:hypothetical protein
MHDIPLDRSKLLGDEGDEIWYVFNVVAPFFLTAMAGTNLGVATAALETAREHLKRRRHTHSGLQLSTYPVLQHRLGTLWATVERTRRLLYFAAEEAQNGGPAALLALCSAKAEVAQTVDTVTNEAMTLWVTQSRPVRRRTDVIRPGAVGEEGWVVDAEDEQPQPAGARSTLARHRRPRENGHRTRRVNLRLSDVELQELTAAADRVGETPAGYAARGALAVSPRSVRSPTG